MIEIKTKVIPAKKVRQFYKRFANGEQFIELNPFGKIEEICKLFYWQHKKVYNHIKSLIDLYGKHLNEEQLYGRNGLVSLLEPYQREYNEIMNKHSEHIDFATLGVIVVEDGSVDTDEFSEEGLMAGKVIVYRQGARTPELQKHELNTRSYLESADYCYQQMVRITEMFCKAVSDNEA